MCQCVKRVSGHPRSGLSPRCSSCLDQASPRPSGCRETPRAEVGGAAPDCKPRLVPSRGRGPGVTRGRGVGASERRGGAAAERAGPGDLPGGLRRGIEPHASGEPRRRRRHQQASSSSGDPDTKTPEAAAVTAVRAAGAAARCLNSNPLGGRALQKATARHPIASFLRSVHAPGVSEHPDSRSCLRAARPGGLPGGGDGVHGPIGRSPCIPAACAPAFITGTKAGPGGREGSTWDSGRPVWAHRCHSGLAGLFTNNGVRARPRPLVASETWEERGPGLARVPRVPLREGWGGGWHRGSATPRARARRGRRQGAAEAVAPAGGGCAPATAGYWPRARWAGGAGARGGVEGGGCVSGGAAGTARAGLWICRCLAWVCVLVFGSRVCIPTPRCWRLSPGGVSA